MNSADVKALARLRQKLVLSLACAADDVLQEHMPVDVRRRDQRLVIVKHYLRLAIEKAVDQDRRFRARRGVR